MIVRDPESQLCHERLLSWDIRPGDVAMVIGGYQGETCEFILDRYPECQLYTWEPQRSMFDMLLTRVGDRPQLRAFNYGIGIQEAADLPMVQEGNYFCSYVLGGEKPNYSAPMREWGKEMDALAIREIAWLHLNAEGYEYLLLPYLVEIGWMKRIGQLVVATHPLPEPPLASRAWPWICSKLTQTHVRYWQQRQFWAWSRPDRQMIDLSLPMFERGPA